MSTNLQLVQRLHQETLDTGTGPSTVVGQVGQHGRSVLWIHSAWTELQQEREDWIWMRKSFTVQTVASDGEYAYGDCDDTVTAAAIERWARWYPYTFKCYLTSGGVANEGEMIWIEWERFRRQYRYGTQNDGQPVHVSQDPTGKFCLGPKPDAIYTVSGDYQIGPQDLSAGADPGANVPEMPTRFHSLIVYEAMSKFGGNSVAPEAILRANTEGGRLRAMLELDQLPKMQAGDPLA